jgi:hypothetical protein
MVQDSASNLLAARSETALPPHAGADLLDLKQWATALGRWWRRKPSPPQPAPQILDRTQVALPRTVPAGAVTNLAEGESTDVDDHLKKRIKELGEAINHSLSESEPIAETIGRIKAEGYDVFLVLEATIGFTRQDGEGEEAEPQAATITSKSKRNGEPKFQVNAQDMKFLKSMKIAVEE